MNDQIIEGLATFNNLKAKYPNANVYFEINSWDTITIRVHGIEKLIPFKKVLNETLKVPKLDKSSYGTTQYAFADIGEIHITAYAKDTFEGCKIQEINEQVLIPAKPATEAQPEHYETVVKKVIKCGNT